ncbi:MAG: thioredoxin family protein [Chitinispirillaceae bacterium]|nr:thioredoxin family protein [Chitinispirillaceae bacterium]
MNRKLKTVSTTLVIFIISLLYGATCGKPKKLSDKNDNGQQLQTPASRPESKTPAPPSPIPLKDPVESIGSLDELISIVEGSPGQLLVFDLYADWCMPCKILLPTFTALAGAHSKNARFFRVDLQRNPDIASAFRVNSIPMVVFMKDKEVVHALKGLNPKEYYERVITMCGPSIPAAECRTKLEGTL